MSSRLVRRLCIAVVVAALAVGCARAAAAPATTVYQLPRGAHPLFLTESGDGIWVTEGGAGAIALILPNGQVAQLPLPADAHAPYDVAPSADGGVWFSDQSGIIGRLSNRGSVVGESHVPANVHGLVPDASDGVWFGYDAAMPGVAHLGAAGQVSSDTVLPDTNFVSDVILGPDGQLWLAEGQTCPGCPATRIASFSETTLASVPYPLPLPGGSPFRLAVGPGKAIWFDDSVRSGIGHVSAGGQISERALPPALAGPADLALGGDHALWFTTPRMLGRITATGAITSYAVALATSQLGLASDSSGLWIADTGGDRVVHTQLPASYVALGDSYSSGEGITPFLRDGVSPSGTVPGTISNACHRSTRAYAEQVGPAGDVDPVYALSSTGAPGTGSSVNKYGSDHNVRQHGLFRWADWACSGALIANVLPSRQGGRRQYHEPHTQIDEGALSAQTTLVTITIGGNDAGFVDVLKHCALHECDTASYRNALYARIDGLAGRLLTTYRATRARAPAATVLVLGYPQAFPASSGEQGCLKLVPWRGEQTFLRTATTRINGVIRRAAATAGVTYVDPASAFAGHEICGHGGAWINGPTPTWNLDRDGIDDASFHPNLRGQAAYAQLVRRALG